MVDVDIVLAKLMPEVICNEQVRGNRQVARQTGISEQRETGLA